MKIEKKNILLFIFIFSCIPPNALMVYPAMKGFCNLVQIVGFLYFLMAIIKRKVASGLFIFMGVFDLILLLSTLLGNQQYNRCLTEIFNNLGIPMIFVSGLYYKEKIISVFRKYFNLLCWINFAYLIIGVFAQGKTADDSLFIISANSITIYFIVALTIEIIYSDMINSKKTGNIFLLGIVCSFSELMVWSGTGMIAWFIFLSCFILSQLGKKKNIPYFASNIGTVIASAVLVSSGLSSVFNSFLEFLGKDITLTGRTYIWASAINKITASPTKLVLGYGYGEPAFNHYVAHNQILELLTNGGILLLISFFAIYIYIGIREKKYVKDHKSKGVSIIKAAIFGIGIDMMTEIEPMSLVFLVFMLIDIYIHNSSQEGESCCE